MGTRRALVAAGVVIVVLVAILLKKSHDEPATVATHSEAPPTSVAPPAPQPIVPAASEPAPALPVGEAQPQPVPLPEGVTPPPLDGKRSEPAPPQKPFTPEEQIAKREADLKLLDDTKTRLEDQLAAAHKANDATTAHDLEIRIARLADVRKKRSDELEKLRAGGSAQ
jgi:hypothetical protein